jgi:anthranilate phosphoribosyltransferase
MNLDSALKRITNGHTLSEAEAEVAMSDIMEGSASPLQIAAMLGALRMRGETIEEITGFARAMRARALPVRTTSTQLVDTCGTGGDAPKHGVATFNISTAAAFIAAGAGAVVAKHGNRAQSSKCGSADVLEALGVNLNRNSEQIAACIDAVGIGFMFAQTHHPAMKHVAPIRRELGIRTIFNLLGPLTNPAGATSQVMGVSDMRWVRPIAEVLLALGTRHAIVAHSEDGTDEFSTCAPTHYIEVKDGALHEGTLDPAQLCLACTDPSLLQGGDAQHNATIINQLLHDGEGATADIACLNAAAVLVAADHAPDFEEGLRLARASANSGAAREKLALLIAYSNRP